MEAIELKAESREALKRGVKTLRQQGYVPAVIYGKDIDSEPLKIEARALDKVLSIAGTHQLISLQVGKQQPKMTLARDIQRDVVKRNYLHVDFYAVKMDEKVAAQIPLLIEGESPAVKDLGGVLTQGLDQLDIECLPGDLISSISVNVDSLTELNATLTVADLTVPDTITILSDSESMVVKIEPPRLVSVDEELEAEEMAEAGVEPEVITEAKDEEE